MVELVITEGTQPGNQYPGHEWKLPQQMPLLFNSAFPEDSLWLLSFYLPSFLLLFFFLLLVWCCTWAFSTCSEWASLFVAVCIAAASPGEEHRLWAHRLQQVRVSGSVLCCSRVVALTARRTLGPGAGIEPMSTASARQTCTAGPPGKSPLTDF